MGSLDPKGPMHKGTVGAGNLNMELQKALSIFSINRGYRNREEYSTTRYFPQFIENIRENSHPGKETEA